MALAGPLHPCPERPAEPPSRPPAPQCRAPPKARALSPPAESLGRGFPTLPKSPISKKPAPGAARAAGHRLWRSPPAAAARAGAAGWAGARCGSRGAPGGCPRAPPAPPRDAGSAAAGPPPTAGRDPRPGSATGSRCRGAGGASPS